MSEAREIVKQAIQRRGKGAVLRVADASGINFVRLYAFMKGSDLSPENAGKLRAVLYDEVPPEVWLELCSPLPQEAPAPAREP